MALQSVAAVNFHHKNIRKFTKIELRMNIQSDILQFEIENISLLFSHPAKFLADNSEITRSYAVSVTHRESAEF